MQIHDELIYEVGSPEGSLQHQQAAFLTLLRDCMENEVSVMTDD